MLRSSQYNTYHRRYLSPRERFADGYVVDKKTGCWNWIRRWNGNAYGYFWLNGKSMKAHRVAWILFKGVSVPKSIGVLHRCDNPPCVNPDHLFLGTAQDNTDDMMNKGRNVPRRGEESSSHKLSTKQVLEIKSSTLLGVELARIYQVGPMQISRIRRGLRWGHVNSTS